MLPRDDAMRFFVCLFAMKRAQFLFLKQVSLFKKNIPVGTYGFIVFVFETQTCFETFACSFFLCQARIIAMTCTHAALIRRRLVKLGFKYDNMVMEESAQILEVETFIPMMLQV